MSHAPEPGSQAPDFTLPTADGRTFTLSAAAAERPLVLLFYRGHW